jgi:hypothetical protein
MYKIGGSFNFIIIIKKYFLIYINMPKKVEQFEQERKEILEKVFNLLDINQDNNKFLLGTLEHNIEKQNKIYEMESDIKKVFICSRWSCFLKSDMRRRYLSIIKYLLKEMDYDILPIRKRVGGNIRDTEYHIINHNAKLSV